MKKSIKNTIMIGMAVVLCGTSAITFSYASQGAKINKGDHPPQIAGQFDQNSQNPIEGFGNDNQNDNQFDSQSGQQNEQAMPPQRNDNGSQNKSQQSPPNDNQNGQTQDGDQSQNNNQNSNQNNGGGTSSKGTALSSETSENETLQMPQNMPQQNDRSTGVLSILCYAFFALQVMIIFLILAYLALSKFNRISFNEVTQSFASKSAQNNPQQ